MRGVLRTLNVNGWRLAVNRSCVLRLLLVGVPTLLLLVLGVRTARAQDIGKKTMERLLADAEDEYRRFFKRPEKPHEFWAAMKFELDAGKLELAAYHLKLMLELPKEEVDNDLAKIEQEQGMFPFLRLRYVK